MKLYYSPGACSLSPHIVMAELNMAYELEAVNMQTKMTANGENYLSINMKGAVPAIKMDNGELLTEGAIISQFLCDSSNTPHTMLGKFGTIERLRTLEWMNFVATDIHKSFSPLFGVAFGTYKNDATKTEIKEFGTNNLNKKLTFISEKLGSNDFLTGKNFTIADAYLFTCLNWSKTVGFDYSNFSNIMSFMNRVSERPAVMKAMKEEGLLK